MKKLLAVFLAALLLSGCGSQTVADVTTAPTRPQTQPTEAAPPEEIPAPEYTSRFSSVTEVALSDAGITVNGAGETESVFLSRDIIYYEDKDQYESGNPYGEGETHERHSAEEADSHVVVNITAPGAYRLSGALSAGQIRIDLGDDAYEDPDARVELILSDAEITCTVAPAILFLNTYECDGNWSADSASPTVDTSAAGANLILEGSSTVTGSHVAKIFKDKDGEKKLWKQDGAIYSYMSMNVFGPGALTLTADNEGLDTELHLTVNGGDISIFSDNDGINTNEDGVSVTTINGGNLRILAGLGAEGDGIDSNGYLVINGGNVIASANPAADAGMDSDLGSFIHGGTVLALGSTMDWAESDSRQVTMNLQFARQQESGSTLSVTASDGTVVFSCAPDTGNRTFSGAILSFPALAQGETYHVFLNDILQQYTGTDVGRGGFGGGMRKPGIRGDGEMPTPPDGQQPDGNFGGGHGMGGQRPEGEQPEGFSGMTPPGGFDGEAPALPEGETFPEGEPPRMPTDGFGGRDMTSDASQPSTEFYMNDKVNAFSGISAVA